MSEDKPESGPETSTESGTDDLGISDEQLPEDVRPSEDNPLARHPDQTGDADDEIGADTEGDPETAPLTEEDADYSHGSDDG